MLATARLIARNDLRRMLRQRETLLWTFGMPPVFFFFIGTITGGFGNGDASEPLAVLAPPAAGFLAAHVERRLEEQGFALERRADSAAFRSAERRLAIPAGFTDSVLGGRRVTLTFGTDEEGPDAEYDRVRVARAVYATLGDVAVTAAAGETPTPAALLRLASEPRTLTLRVEQAGPRVEPPTGFEQAVPGTMVMFTLLVLLTSGAVPLVLERQAGLLRRLASTPLPRGGVALGKWGARMALGIIQIAFAMLLGRLLFGVTWGPDLAMVCAVLLAWAALAAALGLVLGNLARTEGQATAVGVLASLVLGALGGCWWPIEVTPRWMQQLSLTLPTGIAMDALHRLASFEAGAASAAPHVAVLAAAALGAGWLAARTFRYR